MLGALAFKHLLIFYVTSIDIQSFADASSHYITRPPLLMPVERQDLGFSVFRILFG
jgi:hypothetical protein